MTDVVAQQDPAYRTTFGRAVAAEWLKLRTLRATFWLVLAFVVITAAMAATSSEGGSDPGPDAVASRLTAGLFLSVLLLSVVGVIAASSEWTTGLVRVSLAVTPRRSTWVLAKAVVVAVVAVVATILALALAWPLSLLRYSGSSTRLEITDPQVLNVVLGAPVYVGVITLLSLAIGVLVRHSGGAVGAVLALLFLLPLLVPALGVAALQGVLPTVAGQALMGLPTPFSAGLSMVLAVLWAVVPLAAAIWSLNRRDA